MVLFGFGKKLACPLPKRHCRDGQSRCQYRQLTLLTAIRSNLPSQWHGDALFGLGCFWGAERKFWQQNGVFSTAVGYAAGITPNPTYNEVCSGMTGHNEVVLVVFDPKVISYETLLKSLLGKSQSYSRNASG